MVVYVAMFVVSIQNRQAMQEFSRAYSVFLSNFGQKTWKKVKKCKKTRNWRYFSILLAIFGCFAYF